jgi:cytoskeletal protein RodZ
VISVKELGEELSILRKSNGVSREEACNDLGITITELECLENGNFKVFKDVYELKRIVLAYAKYLGLPEDKILDEFNDYLFEKTSKISKIDIAELQKQEEEEKVSSPYTKVGKTRHDVAPIVLLVVLLMFISLIVYLVLSALKKKDDEVVTYLQGKEVICYELTK